MRLWKMEISLEDYLDLLRKQKQALTRKSHEYYKLKAYISIVKEMITMEPPKQKHRSRHKK